jgi:DNA (cytosine-5)-methyltransferase 1
VAGVERNPFAAATFVEALGQAGLGEPAVWDDLLTFNGVPWRGQISIVSAGFPCQSVSVAGKREGVDGEAWIWPAVAACIRDVRPELVFLENSDALPLRGLDRVLGDLAVLGFDAEWTVLRASDLGAPHERARTWILAWRVSDAIRAAIRIVAERRASAARSSVEGHALSGDLGEELADASGHRLQGLDADRATATPALGAGADVGHGNSDRRSSERIANGVREGTPGDFADGPGEDGIVGWAWPPTPGDGDGWVEWIGSGGPEPGLRGGADGIPDWHDRLYAIGSAVVPVVAAAAFAYLAQRAGEDLDDAQR